MAERVYGSVAAMRFTALLLASLAAMCVPRAAHAAERHFGFNYETTVQPAGTAELEPWTALRAGRVD